MGWPLIGETLQFLEPHSPTSIGRFMHAHITRYGPVFKSRLFGHATIVSTDAVLNRFILGNEEKLFRVSYPSSVCRIMGRWSMLVLMGDTHKRMRTLACAFTSPAHLHHSCFLGSLNSLVLNTLSSWPPDVGIVRAAHYARQFTMSLMLRHMLSIEPGEVDSAFFLREYESFMKGLIALPINLPGTSYRAAFKSKEKILEKINEIMVKRLKKSNTCSMRCNDFLQFIMEDGSLVYKEQVLDLVMNLLFAGHETSYAAITLAIAFLAESPSDLQKLREEHLAIRAASRKHSNGYELEGATLDDYKAMNFTHCVIKETVRLGNIVRFVHREAMQDVTFGGYVIPKGWKVLPIFAVPHLDEALYKDPLSFRPERWQDPNLNKSAPYFTPFGGGLRLCAGIELARLQISIFLHHLVLNYDWTLAQPKDRDNHAIAFPYVDFPTGLPINVKRL